MSSFFKFYYAFSEKYVNGKWIFILHTYEKYIHNLLSYLYIFMIWLHVREIGWAAGELWLQFHTEYASRQSEKFIFHIFNINLFVWIYILQNFHHTICLSGPSRSKRSTIRMQFQTKYRILFVFIFFELSFI